MVTRHIGVQVLPCPLNFIVVRAIRRQEVQSQALSLDRGETDADLLRRVDAIVVQYDMNHLGIAVMRDQLPQQENE